MSEPIDLQYRNLVGRIYQEGQLLGTRTGVPCYTIWGATMEWDCHYGIPLLQHKRVPIKTAIAEIVGFIRGETDIRWYQERGCRIWDADWKRWHGPDLERDHQRLADKPGIPGLAESVKFREENPWSLGRIYGAQWRNFNGTDQVASVLHGLVTRSDSRRLIISGWNPAEFHLMCLPPCHVLYHFRVRGEFVDLAMTQRSCDTGLGVPFNWFNCGVFLHIMAGLSGLKPGRLFWAGNDVHIYHPHMRPLNERLYSEEVDNLIRDRSAPDLRVKETTLGKLDVGDIEVLGYDPLPKLELPLFVG